MASTDCDSTFDLETLLADAQDLVDESFVARALLQPETNPWETFPLGLLYPAHEPFNEVHYSLLGDFTENSLAATKPTIKSEPVEDVDLLSSPPQPQCDLELAEYLHFTHDDSDATHLSYPDTNDNPAAVSPSWSPTETVPLLNPAEYLYFPDQLDYPTTPAIVDSSSFSAISLSPTTTVSPSSSLSLSCPSYTDTERIHIVLEDLQHSTVPLDGPSAGEPQLDFEELQVCYTFVDPHEKPRKRRAKGIKNSTPIACTFCRRRKIRCGGPQEGGTCKSCIRLNHKGDCVFPAVSYRGQRLGGSAAKRKSKDISKHTSHSYKSP